MYARYLLLLPVACLTWSIADAQIGKRILNRAKTDAENKVKQRINREVDKGVDKAVNEVDTLLTGKKTKTGTKNVKESKPGVTIENSMPAPTYESPDKFAARMNTEISSNTLFTDVKCEQGKKTVEKRLKGLKGIKSSMVDIQNGEIRVSYDPNEIAYKSIIAELNNLGFEADGNPPVAGKKGCK